MASSAKIDPETLDGFVLDSLEVSWFFLLYVAGRHREKKAREEICLIESFSSEGDCVWLFGE